MSSYFKLETYILNSRSHDLVVVSNLNLSIFLPNIYKP